VQHRELMAQVVLRHSQETHEDFAIVTIHPIPDNVLQFDAVHEVVQEFMEEHMDIRVRDIQPSHLGQALVQFNQARDRDLLINLRPHPYGGVNFHLERHNQGRNWHALNFNRDCWLMLLGFPLDYWNHDCIQGAIASFGRVLLWENDRQHLAWLLVRVRVTELQEVPHFIVLTDAEGFQGESWAIQCKIIEQWMLCAIAADGEGIPVPDANGNPSMFDFFGLSQPGATPSAQQAILGEEGVQGDQVDGGHEAQQENPNGGQKLMEILPVP
jgi:hypothetical protein